MRNQLYAWADTTNIGVGDHTWVTTYEPGSGVPDPAKGDYWYCKGDIHFSAILLCSGSGGVDFAQSLARAHDEIENVGIEYGKDGVCHQMANRLLRFSLNNENKPVTVEGAKGYQLTKGMYGTYGEKSITANISGRFKKWQDAVSKYEKILTGDCND